MAKKSGKKVFTEYNCSTETFLYLPWIFARSLQRFSLVAFLCSTAWENPGLFPPQLQLHNGKNYCFAYLRCVFFICQRVVFCFGTTEPTADTIIKV